MCLSVGEILRQVGVTGSRMTAAATDADVSWEGGPLPAIYVNHGGGPMPLLGQQPEVASFLSGYAATLPRPPRAVLVVTAHWEEGEVTVSTGASAPLLFDYSGFPPEAYAYRYAAPGAPRVAAEVLGALRQAGIVARAESSRGWDHGVFVPMMLMFPKADVPIVQMSLRSDQQATHHLAVGAALQGLRRQGVLIVGSGVSFHNFAYFFARDQATKDRGAAHSRRFDEWLRRTLTDEGRLSPEERLKALEGWETAPSARDSHPPGAAEHLLPLLVVAGAAGGVPASAAGGASVADDMMGFVVSKFEFA